MGEPARRLWRLPLVAHAAALFVLLLVVLPLSRPGTAAMSDEGAAILQARLLEHSGSWLLPRLVGLPTALRILYSGDFVSAAEALEIGYVAAVVPPDDLMATRPAGP